MTESLESAEKFNANNYSVQELLQLLDMPPHIEDVSENDIITVTNSNITKYKGKALSKQLIAPRESAQYMQLALFYREIQVKLVTAAKAAAKMENADRAATQAARERVQAAQGAHGTWDPVIAKANADASAAIRARSRQEAAEAATQAVKDAWRYGGTDEGDRSEVYDRQQEEYAQFDVHSNSRLRVMSDPNEQLRWARNQYLPWEPKYTETDVIQITVKLTSGTAAEGQMLKFSDGATATVGTVEVAEASAETSAATSEYQPLVLTVITTASTKAIKANASFTGTNPECTGTVTKVETTTDTGTGQGLMSERAYRAGQAQLAATNRQNQFELAVDENGHYIMKQRQLSIPSAYNVPIAQGTMNPTLRNMYTRIVVINSKRRATLFPHTTDPAGASSSTNFNVQLSEELKNVVSLQMLSITLPYSWYAVDAATGTNCFHITATQIDPVSGGDANSVTTTITVATGNYTPVALMAEIQSRLSSTDESTLIKKPGSATTNLTASYVEATGKCMFKNTSGGTVKFKLTFFDPRRVLDCGASCRQSNKINNCLGWILGFRSNSVHTSVMYNSFALDGMVYDVPATLVSGTGYSLTGEAVIDTYGSKYFMLVLEDYKNNRINGGVVSVTNTETRLDTPYYYDADIPCENIPNPFGGTTDKITVNIPSEPRTLTEAQLYTVNEIRRNRDLTRVDRVAEPTSSNVFAMINFNKNGLAVGSAITDASPALAAYTRDYFGPVTLQRLKITLVDDNGFIVNLNGNDWSFTFAAKSLYEY
jgi:hypothetical protein